MNKMNKSKILLALVLIALLVIAGYWAYWKYLAPAPAALPPTPQNGQEANEPITISAEGRVVPARYASLSFSNAGTIEAVAFAKGEQVEEGAIIARLQNKEQSQAARTAAELELLSAQQALDALYESADLSAAQASKAVADGRDAVRDAEQRLNNLKEPASQADIDMAEASVNLSRTALERARKELKLYLRKPESNPKRAAAQLLVALLEKQYDAAVRKLNYLQGKPNEITLAQAEADLDLARAQLEDAERQHESLEAGPDPDDIELAEARLANAAAQLAAAQAALEHLELRAPFNATIISSNLKEGEYVLPGAPMLVLADLSAWQIETSDLAETDVALLQEGAQASMEIDAFPGQQFSGVVRAIDYRGQDSRGEVTYMVTLDFDPGQAPVRWGMTAFVDIQALDGR